MVGWRAAMLVLGGSFAALPAPCPAHARPQMNMARPHVVRVGPLTLHACGERGAYCGRLDRPLDPAGELPDRISIYFEHYPHSGPHSGALPSGGTLVATEGGPGYPATESRDDYLALFGPLRRDHDVIIMDNRGTGRSGALDCRALQTAATWTIDAVAACGESLSGGSVNALPRARSTCAAKIVRRFLATTLPGDTACAARVPPVRLVARFATGFGDLDAAVALPGNQATTSELQMLSAAVLTAGDVLARAPALTSDHGAGLRGGTFRVIQRASGTEVILDEVKWTGDLAVNGRILRNASHRVSADLTLVATASTAGTGAATAAGTSGRVSIRWPDEVAGAAARIDGHIGGHRVAARLPAP